MTRCHSLRSYISKQRWPMPGAALEIMRNLGKLAVVCRGAQALLSATLLWAFFQPWATGMGGPASALQLRDRLEGPSQIASLVTRKGRIARDYRLAGRVWTLGAAEGISLASALWLPLTGWPGLATGLAASGTAQYTRSRIKTYPFQKPGRGATATVWLGAMLAAVSGLRLLAERRR